MSDVDLTFLCNRVCTIDPYRAAVILKHVNYPLNRKKDARVIKSYRDAMMEHNWMRPIDISFVAVPVDTVPPEYRNGNGCIWLSTIQRSMKNLTRCTKMKKEVMVRLMLKCSRRYLNCKHRKIVDAVIFATCWAILMVALACGYNSAVPAYQ